MRQIVFCVWAVFLLVLGVWAGNPAFSKISNRVVAVVNNDVITLYELNRRIRLITGSEPSELRSRNEKLFVETRRKILDMMIDEKIAREKIEELGIKVDAAEVDEAIERIKKNNDLTHEDLLEGLKKQGMNYEAYREGIREELERMRLINFEVKSKIIIREESIKEYYEQHRDDFKIEEKVHLAAIFLRNDREDAGGREALLRKAREVISRLEAGADFEALAKQFSDGPAAEEGGDLGSFRAEELDPNLREILKTLSPGEVTPPVESESAVKIIKLKEKEEGRVRAFEEVRDTIHDILYRKEVNRLYSSWIDQLRENAYTKIVF